METNNNIQQYYYNPTNNYPNLRDSEDIQNQVRPAVTGNSVEMPRIQLGGTDNSLGKINNYEQVVAKSEYVPDHEQYHISVGEYLKSAVYGGTDGVINSLAVIIGGIASGTAPWAIFAIGISVVVGDGIGMGLGDYLSAKAQKQFILSEEKREYWEVQNKLEDEKAEIVEIYQQKNYTPEQSKRLAELFATNPQAFVNVMMLQQLGLVVDDSNPIINGIVNTVSFMILGFIPLIPYLVGRVSGNNQTQYLWVIAIGAVQLFSLGFAKSTLIQASIGRRIFSGLQTVFFAAIALAAGYGIGKIFQGM